MRRGARRGVPDSRRRWLLATVAAGAAGAVTGCSTLGGTSADGSDGEPGPDTPSEGLQWFYGDDPSTATWFGTGAFPGPTAGGDGEFARPGPAWDLTMAPELWGGWLNDFVRLGEVRYGLYESVDIAPERVRVRIREDARWSNGDRILGRDAVPVTMAARLTTGDTPLDGSPSTRPPRPVDAVTDVTWDGSTATFHSADGRFDDFLEERIWAWLAREGDGTGGVWQHTRIEPYEGWFDTVVDLWERATRGAFDPRDDPVAVFRQIHDAVVTGDGEWVRHFSDPEHCVVSGAFEPAEVRASEAIVLERNPEFYAADRVDVEEVVLTRVPNNDVAEMLLNDGSLDYYRGTVRPQVAADYPSTIEERQVPVNGGLAIAVNHGRAPFDRRAFRRAVLAAIDSAEVARVIHGSRFASVTVPGADAHRARELLGAEFVEKELVPVPTDRETAAERLRDIGFARDRGRWLGSDGEPVDVELRTPARPPSLVQAVANQLDAFGFEVTWERTRPDLFSEAGDSGRLVAWPTRRGVGYVAAAVGRLYLETVVEEAKARNWFGIFPESQVDAAAYRSGTLDRTAPEHVEVFELDAPPVGEPDGDRRTWRPAKLGRECHRASTREAYVDALRKLAWLYNWHLPVLPIAHGRVQHFVNTAEYEWPPIGEDPYGDVGAGALQPEDVVALGDISSAD